MRSQNSRFTERNRRRLMLLSDLQGVPDTIRCLEHCLDAIDRFLGPKVREVTFLDFGALFENGPDMNFVAVQKALALKGIKATALSLTEDPLPVRKILEAQALWMGGGNDNAFHMLTRLQEEELMQAIVARVNEGMPYIGVGAGAILAGKSIMTSNDPPIAFPKQGFEALGLVRFHLVVDYPTKEALEKMVPKDPMIRIAEFIFTNNRPTVVALRPDSWLTVTKCKVTLHGVGGAQVSMDRLPLDEWDRETLVEM